jgi:exodeoxyribonuclease V gamma subunit
MLSIEFSNRFESLRESLVARIGCPGSPFIAEQIVIPSSAVRRDLTLAIAGAHGVCANIEFAYLAQWLWCQIGRVVESVEADSPFASAVLAWRIYQSLGDSTWYRSFSRLHQYLKDADPLRRLDLANAIAAMLEQYITYRPDWMSEWLKGEPVALKNGSPSLVDDQAWQAELWRRLSGEVGAPQEHPANRFLRSLQASQGSAAAPSAHAAQPASARAAHPFQSAHAANPLEPPLVAAARTVALPAAVHVFCLPDMPPLYLDVLCGLGRWIDVHLYVLNPCRVYWFEIVDPKRLSRLGAGGTAAHEEIGNRLLASWGRQTQAHIELLLDRAEHAPMDDAGFREDFPPTILGHVQRSIYDLVEFEPKSIEADPADRSIEVHVCHSLTRELEVLQDQLLALFASAAPPKPSDILVVTPDLESAAALIDAVFENAPADRRLPYKVSGRGRSTINVPARALLALLSILPSRFQASTLLELLQQPIIGRRFGIGSDELLNIEAWMQDSGIRWGIDGAHRREFDLPGVARFSVEDGLNRLFLGYALPQHVSLPLLGRVPAGNAEGSGASDLGLFAHFFHRLTALRTDFMRPREPDAWLASLCRASEDFLLPGGDELDDLKELWGTLGELHANMARGGLTAALPLAVIHSALKALLDHPARGGVPTGSITFSSMTSLRNLPFRVICVIGLNDGAFPQVSRPTEFDLMAAEPRRGDRQRRCDDRNLFLDLLLAAREKFYLSYTGRSIRDNGILPASVVVSELIETLVPALARDPADPASLAAARARLVVEHPLQAFSPKYFAADGDPRLFSFNRELCDALRHSLARVSEVSAPQLGGPALQASALDASALDAAALDAPAEDQVAEDAADDTDDEENADRSANSRFFTVSLAQPGEEWRSVSLARLLRFFANPCRFLLRERLAIALFREEHAKVDDEPFVPDFKAREALALRLLPHAMRGLGGDELERLADAGIEYPPGSMGTLLLREEMLKLRQFAAAVNDATRPPCVPPVLAHVELDLAGEHWQLSSGFTDLRPAGLVRHRYDDARPTDYLSGWLTHLLLCAAAPPGVMHETRWVSRDGDYRLKFCAAAATILQSLLVLYRQGLREPLHFFPKSAWEYITHGGNLGKARAKWSPGHARARGEDENAAYRLALRGQANPIDAAFEVCALTVFGAMGSHLEDRRLGASLTASRP